MSELETKIRGVLEPPVMASFATVTEDGRPWVRYVMISADEDLNLRFATSVGTRKLKQIEQNPEVHMTCGVTDLRSAEAYLQIAGRATVSTEQSERDRIWNPMLRRYYEGPEDPRLAVVKVVPYRIELMTMSSMTPEVWEAE